MADKRISQLIERTDIANNDVLPIVASGATTTNKVTISTIQEWMQDNLDVGVTSVGITIGSTGTDINVTGSPITTSGNITINIPTASATNRGLLSSSDWSSFNSKLSSVGLTMPSAFTVSNSPLTANGTIAVTGAGTVSQYIRGDGSLADFPEAGGGGASVSYYLNGSVSQGTIGGVAYLEMNKTPILGGGTNFTINANGYIASFITDAGDPNLLLIPGGNWNLETYFAASSGGGTPSFYVELYKVDSGGTATLIASNSANPELIAFGTTTTAYFSSLAVPATVLTLTDRLALRYYVTHSGRTITMHTEDGNLCQVITTFTTGLTALNGLTAQVQNFATGTSGTDFNISSSSATHTFNLPDASASNRGAVTTGSQIFGGVKTFANGLSLSAVGGSNQVTRIVNIGTLHEGSATLNQIGFNSGNNIYFGKGLSNGGVIQWNNAAVRYYTLPDADGTIALTSQLDGYVTLNTAQTITAQKTFTTSGSSDTMIISHGSGSGIALDVIKAGNGQAIRVQKTSGSGEAVTITGDASITGAFSVTNSTSTFAVMNSTNANGGVLTFRRNGTNVGHIGNSAQLGGGVLDAIEVRSGVGSSVILRSDGGQVTLATGGGVTLTGALNGTSASFSGSVSGLSGTFQEVTTTGTTDAFYNANRDTSSYANGLRLRTSTNNNWLIGTAGATTNLIFYNYDLATSPLTLSYSTGAATFSSSGFNVATFNSTFGQMAISFANSGTTFSQIGSGVSVCSTAAADDLGFGTAGLNKNIVFATGTGFTERMRITSGGDVCISSTAPVSSRRELRIGGNAAGSRISMGINGTNYSALVTDSGGNVYLVNEFNDSAIKLLMVNFNNGVYLSQSATSWTSNSDERLKNINGDIENAVDKLCQLRAINFSWKNDDNKKENLGLIAQDVEKVFPQVIDSNTLPNLDENQDADKTEYLGVRYQELVPVLIKAIQELKTEIDSLKNQMQ